MPTAHSVAVAEAVVAQLVALSATLAQPIEPVRSYADWDKPLETVALEECDRLAVDVVAVESAPEHKVSLTTRGKLRYIQPVDIAIRKRLGSEEQNDDTGRIEVATVDELVALVEQIHESFAAQRLASLTDAVWDPENPPKLLCNPLRSHLRQFRQFTGIVRLTFRINVEI